MTKITVIGNAEARVPADLANIFVTHVEQGARRDEVLREANRAHAELVARAKELVDEGVASGYFPGGVSTYSHTWRDERGEPVVEHRAQATLRLFVNALDRVGEVAAELTERGADTNVTWELLNETCLSLMSGLRAQAVEDARAAAEDYAKASGASTVSIVSIRDNAGSGTFASLGEARMAVQANQVPELMVGEITVSAQAEVEFDAE